MAHKTIGTLEDVLSQERAALMSGQFDGLAALADRKRHALNALEKQNPSAAQLRMLKSKMDSNQDLIAAALQGVAAAKDRISALEQVRDGLRTYGQDGTVAVVPQHNGVLLKKA